MITNLHTIDKKLSKWVYALLKVGLIKTVPTNFPFSRNIIKKWRLSISFSFIKNRHVWITSIEIITKMREAFIRFEQNKNVINIAFPENWFKFFWVLFKIFDFIKLQKIICRSEGRSNSHAIFLFITNIIKYEYTSKRRFLNSDLFMSSITFSLF